MSSKRSPRTSECSTASPGIQASPASLSASTATLPPVSAVSIDGTSTPASTTPSSSALTTTTTKNSSAFSVIGKTLTRLIQNCYAGKPTKSEGGAAVKNGGSSKSKRLVRKHLIRRRILAPTSSHSSSTSIFSDASTSSLSGRREIQKWFFSCNGCSRPITRDDVKADNAIFAMDGVWHRSHLVCFKCNANIGDEYRPFIASGLKDKLPLCLDCHMVAEHQTCTVCHTPLFESCVEIDEKQMHQSCFVCERCKAPFEDGQYALINGNPYDLDCYYFKAYESAFAQQLPGSFFDLHATSPPPTAAASDSSTSLPSVTPTTSAIEDQTYFKRKTAEFVSLCDVGHPLPPPEKTARKELSAEVFETENIKFPLKSPPTDARSPTLDLGSKEKIVAAITPPSGEKVDGKSETKRSDGPESAAAAGGNEVKKGEEKKDEKRDQNQNAAPPSESPSPHPDTYAAAAALTPQPAAEGIDGKSETKETEAEKKKDEQTKIEEKKGDKPITPATESPPPHPDTYADAAALAPQPAAEGINEKSVTKNLDGTVSPAAAAAGNEVKKVEEKKDEKKNEIN